MTLNLGNKLRLKERDFRIITATMYDGSTAATPHTKILVTPCMATPETGLSFLLTLTIGMEATAGNRQA